MGVLFTDRGWGVVGLINELGSVGFSLSVVELGTWEALFDETCYLLVDFSVA